MSHYVRDSYIPSFSVMRRRGSLIQKLPVDVAHQLNLPEQIKLPEASILHIQLPSYVRKTYWQMMDILARASSHCVPEWAMQVSTGLRKGPPYDFTRHHEEQCKLVAQASKSIGWNGRQLILENTIEHYRWQRYLRFEEFKICLRNEILAALNEGIMRAGKQLGFASTIMIDGLPTLADVKRLRMGLIEGKSTFKDILETFSRTFVV